MHESFNLVIKGRLNDGTKTIGPLEVVADWPVMVNVFDKTKAFD